MTFLITPTTPKNQDGTWLLSYPPDQNGSQIVSDYDKLNGVLVNPTGPLGTGSLLYFRLMYQLPKWGYGIFKYKDEFQINPTYREYYAATLAQKQELETKIKSGLESAARAVADYELLYHDYRKYYEMIKYFEKLEAGKKKLAEVKLPDDKKAAEKMIEEANTSLKSMFVDQVDVQTGDGVSLRTILSRWPSIIVDFMRIKDEMTTTDMIVDGMSPKVSRAAAVVLATKNKLFMEWKEMFRKAVRERYLNILSLMNSRQKSIEEYKRWLRPYIVQHEMFKESFETPESGGAGSTHRITISAHSTSVHNIGLYAWRPYRPGDMFRATTTRREIPVQAVFLRKNNKRLKDNPSLEKRVEEKMKAFKLDINGRGKTTFWINPYDDMVKSVLYGEKHLREAGANFEGKYVDSKNGGQALAEEYPFLTPEEIEIRVFEIIKASESEMQTSYNTLQLHPDYLYYIFWDMFFNRAIISIPQGANDDLMIWVKLAFVSQNVMLAKLVEKWAMEKKFDYEVEEMLGLRKFEVGKSDEFAAGITGKLEDFAKKQFPNLYGVAESKNPIKEALKITESLNDFLGKFNIDFMLYRKGPYESTTWERITRVFSKAFAETWRSELFDWFYEEMKLGQ